MPLPTPGAALQDLTAVERQTGDLDQFSDRIDHRFDRGNNLFAISTFDAGKVQLACGRKHWFEKEHSL